MTSCRFHSTPALRFARSEVTFAAAAALSLALCGRADAQTPAPAPPPQDPTVTNRVEAAEAYGDVPKRELLSFNHFEGRWFSVRVGGGVLFDYSTYSQDEDSETQMAISPLGDLRDFRLLAKGKVLHPNITYTIGYMYDKAADAWRFRQTGIMVAVPRLHGSVFVGRTKEGFSTNKMMVGYQGWANERTTMNDALIPILADGIKVTGSTPGGTIVYNFGFFKDTRSEAESFNKNDKQTAARVVWLPKIGGTEKTVLHFAVEARHARSDDGTLRYRSKPESFQAQAYAIDTGSFTADYANAVGVEAYYRPGPLVFGMEYFVNQTKAPEVGDPLFHGGEIFAAYTLTGEVKPYNAGGAYFERLSPARPVFSGGPGAWELVTRFSYSDLDDDGIRGGRFWRFTPVVNWYLTDNLRLEFVYGYSSLNRFGVVGKTQYFQTRFQFQL
jgi:phosphate-selective porin OprO/OprP